MQDEPTNERQQTVTTDVQVYNGQQGNGLEAKMRYAQAMAQAGLLPKQYRNQPANLLIAIELGQALGIPTIQAVNDIHVIEGKPSASANLIAAMIRKAGHKLRVTTTSNPPTARAELVRADDPEFAYVSEWDVARAERAELLERDKSGKIIKDNWRKYPEQMMRARAITEVARDGATDVLYGVAYTPEELEAQQLPDAELAELEHEAARRRLWWLLKQVGLDDPAAARAAVTEHVGREVTDSKTLTVEELAAVNGALEILLAEQEASAAPAEAAAESHIVDADVVIDKETGEVTPADLPEEMITQKTQRRQRAQRRDLGLEGDDGGPQDHEFWALLGGWFGREFTSSNQQTEAEALQACERMQAMLENAPDPAAGQ